jgi:type IV pilus assembly protein PilY1
MSPCDRAGAPRRRLTSYRRAGLAGVAALLAATAFTALAGTTDLSSVPLPTYTVGSTVDIKPNILLVLDDSGSMAWDYLPDWVNDQPSNYASPTTGSAGSDSSNSGVHSANVPQYLYFNSSYNGVAYNAAVTYNPPITFTSAGAKDTSTYPSMTSAATSSWSAVPNDGYGVQDSGTTSLVNNRYAYFYTMVPGEYCDSPALTNCQTASAASGKFAYPAPLRWCSDQALTSCRGLQSSTYQYPRTPAPRIVTLTISTTNSSGSITGISVDGKQIMSGTATSSGSTSTLATNVATQINNCRYSLPTTTNCTTVGYFAVSGSTSSVVTIYAPGVPAAAPSYTNGGTVSASFSTGGFAQAPVPIGDYFASGTGRSRSSAAVPGENLRTVLTSTTTSYPYPGTTAKSPTRTDCAGTTCTFAEEMTNYANWWAYYRTRMQMMKTATSRAFASLDSDTDITAGNTRYRVGFMSINNNTGKDFVNVTDFNGTQKFTWFSQFLKANPGSNTPLRSALAQAGQLYGGRMTGATFRGTKVTDPLQFSCQKNYTIMSTDGYWNTNSSAPNNGVGSKLDATTMVGNQDGLLARPYNDGATIVTQTRTAQLQMRTNTLSAQKGTLQKQTSQLQVQTSQLQQQTASAQQITQQVQSSTAPVMQSTAQLLSSTSQVMKSTAQLLSSTSQVTKSTAQLLSSTSQVTKSTAQLFSSTSQVTKSTGQLQSSTSTLQTGTSQLQTRTSSNGGVSWTGWSGVSSCTPVTSGTNQRQCQTVQTGTWSNATGTCTVGTPNSSGNFTDCKYTAWTTAANASSCTYVNQSTASPYSVKTATQCSYVFSTAATAPSCTYLNPTTSTTTNTVYRTNPTVCGYAAYTTPASAGSCTYLNQTTATTDNTVYTPTASTCSYGSFSAAATASSCTYINKTTATTDNTAYAAVPTTCGYAAYTTPASASSCTYTTQTTGTTDNTAYTPTAVKCSYAAFSAASTASSCTYINATTATTNGTVYAAVPTTCGYAAYTTPASAGSCTYLNQTTATADNTVYTPTATKCSYSAFSAAATASSCTYLNATTATTDNTSYAVTPTTCTYAAYTTPASATSCSYLNQTTATANNTVYTPTATKCSYATYTTPTQVSSCTYTNPTTVTTDGTSYNPLATTCTYGSFSTAANASACTVVTKSTATTDGTAYNPGVNCSYGAASAATNVASCTVATATTGSANGTVYTPVARSCQYATFGSYGNVSSCTVVAKSTATTNGTVYPTASNCQYTAYSGWSNATSCSVVAQSTSPNYTVGTASNCQYAVSSAFANATSCTPTTTPNISGQTTQCQYSFAAAATTLTCQPQYVSGDYTNATVYNNCSVVPGNWTNVTACTTSATPDANGKTYDCQYLAWTNWANVASCALAPQGTGPSYTGPARDCQSAASGGTTDTLADVAAYYYNTDLRSTTNNTDVVAAASRTPDTTGTCVGPVISPSTTANDLCTDNVPAYGQDQMQSQHMTTHTLGLGATGMMVFSPYQNDLSGNRVYVPDYTQQPSGDFYDVAHGTAPSPSTGICPWQSSGSNCNWPTPASDSPANIDDLWHAAVNGHGTYFSARDPSAVTDALTNVLNQITNTPRPGTAAAAASSNPNITSSDNYVFSSSYESVNWFGELIMQQFNTDGTLTPQQWSAMRLLDCAETPWAANHSYVVGDVYNQGGTCYLVLQAYSSASAYSASNEGPFTANIGSPITRTIYTVGSGALTPFTWAGMNSTQQAYFSMPWIGGSSTTGVSPTGALSQFCSVGASCMSSGSQTAAAGQALVSFLSGDRTNEGTFFRSRLHILGDIVSSEARYVKAPLQTYSDPGYSAFAAANANRLPTVYVGANDGMLHAFDALSGQERWAFIPTAVLPNLYHLADLTYASQHRYFVDGTPETGDICPKTPSTSCGGSDWKTILVGGLNQGGKSFYALDVTDPSNPKYMWEFTATNLGYSYSNPRITKLSNGTWVVIVASGYSNADGIGHLYVINAATGALISDVSNGTGSVSNPDGLARIAARAPLAATDNTVEEVYGGDLLGNVWRFDVNGNIGAPGIDAQLLINLQDPSGNPQPITAKPTVAATTTNVPLVMIGTGRYLGVSDLTDTNTYSMYGIKDTLGTTTLTTPRASGSKFIQQTMTVGTCPANAPSTTCTQGQTVRTSSSTPVDWTVNNGWYLDFPVGGERSTTDATLALGTLVFTTVKPQSATATQIQGCNGSATDINAKSYLYYLDYNSGGAVSGTSNVVGEELCTCIATRPSVVKTVSGNVEGIIRTSGGSTNATSSGGSSGSSGAVGGSTDMGYTQRQDLPYNNTGASARRISWRELNGQ